MTARTTPRTWVASEVVGAAIMNTHVRDNINNLFENLNEAWTSFTPSWTNLTVGNGTNTGAYAKAGNTTFFRILFTFGTTSSISGSVSVNFPATAVSLTGGVRVGGVRMVDSSGSTYYGEALFLSTAAMLITTYSVSGSYIIQATLSSTVPFTWTSTDAIQIAGFYERA